MARAKVRRWPGGCVPVGSDELPFASLAVSAKGSFVATCRTRTPGQLLPLAPFPKPSSEWLVYSGTCRIANSYSSAKAVGQRLSDE